MTDLNVTFPTGDVAVSAVRGTSYHVDAGEVVAIVGESGSGKSTAAMAVIGLLPEYADVSGSVRLHGDELLGLSDRAMSRIRGKSIGTVFQDPMSALTPVYTVGDQIAEAIEVHNRDVRRADARKRAVELLDLVGIAQPPTPRQGVSARAVRRRAPARGHRDRDRQRSRPADLRRTDHRARRHRAGADPRRAANRARRHRRRRADHHPRPGRGVGVRRPGDGHVRRARRRDRHRRRALPRPPDALHRRAAGVGATPGRPAGHPADSDPRRAADDVVAGRRTPARSRRAVRW